VKTNLWSQQGQQNKEDLVDQTFDQLIAETEQAANNDDILFSQLQSAVVSQSFQSTQMTSTSFSSESFQQSFLTNMSQAEQCRRSFEEAELEAMHLESQSSKQISKQSSIIETGSVQSFVYQEGSPNSLVSTAKTSKEAQSLPSKPLRSVSSHDIENTNNQKNHSDSNFQSRQPLKSSSFIRTPDTFTTAQSAPSTPMSQRRRLRINQSPKPPESDNRPKYREQVTGNAFRPGFYRPPPEDTNEAGMFQFVGRTNSRSNIQGKSPAEQVARVSQASSKAYEGDSES